MKLAFVTELFHPSIGGQEVRFEELGQELVKRGHQVDVYTIRFDPSSPEKEVRGGVVVHRIAPSPGYKSKRFRRDPIGILRFTKELWAIRDELKSCDAVLFNIWPILPQLVLGKHIEGKAIVDICETRGGLFWKWVYKAIVSIPRVRILGVNPEIVRHVQRRFSVAPESCLVAVSGVDIGCAGNPPFEKDPKRILFFGRMAEHKNPRLLADAFVDSGIAAEGFKLEFAGGGPELDTLRSEYESRDIVFHGRVSDDEKWNLLRACGLLVMPSRREGFPRVVAEGACVGTPTLSMEFPDNGTCSVLRDYGVGVNCAPTREALSEALRGYAKDRSEYDGISEHCLAVGRVEFSWDTVVDSLVGFIQRKDEVRR